MKLFVLMQDGQPVELPAEQGTVTETHLMDHDGELWICATFAVASTNRRYVEAMRQVLPNLLDADHDSSVYTISEVGG